LFQTGEMLAKVPLTVLSLGSELLVVGGSGGGIGIRWTEIFMK